MSNVLSSVDVGTEISEWIKKFNELKGWDTLTVPKPEVLARRGKDEKFRSSPEGHFERKLEQLGDEENVEEQLKSARQSLSDLKLQQAGTTDPTELERLEDEIDKLGDTIKTHEASLEIIAQVKKQLAELQRVEEQLPEELRDLQQKLVDLRLSVATSAVPLSTLDPKALQRFREFHDMVSKNVESARQEVMTLTSMGPENTEVTRNYAIINSKQYKLLYGTLEEAILTVQLGQLGEATRLVQQTNDKLLEYRTARTGAEKISQRDSIHSDLDEFLQDAERMIDSLKRGGCVKAADARRETYTDVTQRIRAAVNSNSPTVVKDFLPSCGKLLQTCKSDLQSMHRVQQLLTEAGRDVVSMRANGHEDRPGRIEQRISDFTPQADMDETVREAVEIRKEAARLLEECLSEDIKKAKIDPQQLREDLENLKRRYDELFKHHKDGTVKTQKDRRTGQEKEVKKNRDLPRQTIEEIELRIKAAEQLIDSESVDALRDAERYVGNVGIFLDNIDKYPKIYKTFDDSLTEMEKSLKRVASKYALYEVSRRADLQFALEKLRKEYMTKPQVEVRKSIQDQSLALANFKELVSGLRGKKRALFKQADRIKSALDDFGKLLKKSFSTELVSYDGYYGPLRDELAEGRAMIERRTKDSLEEAEQFFRQLEPKVGKVMMYLAPYDTDPNSLKPQQQEVVTSFLHGATTGQTKHNENMAQKDTFEKEVERLEGELKILSGLVKKLKSDSSEMESLETQLEGLAKTTKKEQTYREGVDELKPIATRLERLLSDARGATQIIDATLGDAAREVVTRVRSFRGKIATFYDKVVRPAGDSDSGNPLDGDVFDVAKLKNFFNAIVAAIPDPTLDELEDAARTVANEQAQLDERKLARNTALSTIRSLSAVFEGFKPIDHFRLHPFDGDEAIKLLAGVRQAIPRIEIRLLTAIQS